MYRRRQGVNLDRGMRQTGGTYGPSDYVRNRAQESVIDIAIPGDLRVREKELEKMGEIPRSGSRNEKTMEKI